MEMVDIIDEKLNVHYQASKEEAHEKGLLHKVVMAHILNSKGERLLIEHASHKQDGGQYVNTVGGHVSANESELGALKRETLEEVGIKNFTFTFKGKKILNRVVLNRIENHYCFFYELHSDELPTIGDEAASYKYFTDNQLRKLLKENKIIGGSLLFVITTFYPELLK